jgi:hypothetical protein
VIIITVAVGLMGMIQGGLHKLTADDWKTKRAGLRYGSGMDMFDYQLEKRDAALRQAVQLASKEKALKVKQPADYWRVYHPFPAAAPGHH